MMDPVTGSADPNGLLPNSVRSVLDLGLLGLLVLTSVVLTLRPNGWLRVAVTLACASVVPGYCLCLRLPLRSFDALVGLSIALSLGVEAVLCLAMVWLHLWHPIPLGAGIASICGIVLILDYRGVRPQARSVSVADES
jgi:presenilin-like A22 family membrane protease